MKLEKRIRQIESDDPNVGIGAATAISGVLATSLIIKIANKSGLKDIEEGAKKIQKELNNLIQEDVKAYDSYRKAYDSYIDAQKSKNEKKMKKTEKKMKKSLKRATEIPTMMAGEGYKIIRLTEGVLNQGKKNMVLESYGAAVYGRAMVECAVEIAEANLRQLKDEKYGKKMRPVLNDVLSAAKSKTAEISVEARFHIYSK